MVSQLCFFVSIAFSVVMWSIVAKQYIWPKLNSQPQAEALRPLLILHSFRFIGLAFLVPGVVSSALPATFARAAAYGDIVAAALALLALLLLPRGAGIVATWVFNLWGTVDLLDAFYQANHAGLQPGQLQTLFFIPTLLVPMLLVTHVLIFRVLLRAENKAVVRERQMA